MAAKPRYRRGAAAGPRLDRASIIFDLQSLDAWKLPGDTFLIKGFQAELDVREHDIGRTSGDQIEGLTVFFSRLDRAGRELAPDAVRLDDKAAAMPIGHRGERNFVGAPFPDEDLAALVFTRGPGSGQFKRANILCGQQNDAQQHRRRHARFAQHRVWPWP